MPEVDVGVRRTFVHVAIRLVGFSLLAVVPPGLCAPGASAGAGRTLNP